MKKDLLIAIAFHYAPERIKYLDAVLKNIYDNYKCTFDIIIDSNMWDIEELNGKMNNYVFTHPNLLHPFHLTMCHRQHFVYQIERYDNFAYFEDDMLLPYENYLSYLEKFKFMYPKYVPSFIRLEFKEGEAYVSDVPVAQQIKDVVIFEGRTFFALPFPFHYHGFWIMPQKELKESLTASFTKLDDSRERAATYPMWELKKRGLIEITDVSGKWQVAENCYSYHLPNNYALNTGDFPNGKLLVKDIFI